MTQEQYRDYLLRQCKPSECFSSPASPVLKEAKLHQDIISWCDSQWPRWKYVHARTDQKSTLQIGTPDFILFGRIRKNPVCLVIECKTSTGKLTPEQVAWQHEMALLGWIVRVVRSMDEFLNITKETA